MHWYFEFVGQFCGLKTQDSAVLRTGSKWNDPCFVKSANLLASLVKDGYFPTGFVGENYNVQVTLLESGKAAMAEDGVWLYEPPVTNIGAERFPAIAGAPYNATSGWVGSTLGIPQKAKDPTEAFAFLKFMATNPAIAAQFAKDGDPMTLWGANSHLPTLDAKLVETVANLPQSPPADEVLPFAVGNTDLYALGQGLLSGKLTGLQFSNQLEADAAKAGPGAG
jgi:ABC-type glycerol-3-phosphate transport system substrate-binding protein